MAKSLLLVVGAGGHGWIASSPEKLIVLEPIDLFKHHRQLVVLQTLNPPC